MHPDLSFAQYHIAGLDFNLKKAPPPLLGRGQMVGRESGNYSGTAEKPVKNCQEESK